MMDGKLSDNELEQVNGGTVEIKSVLSLNSAIGSLQNAIKAYWGPSYKQNPYYSDIDRTVGLLQARIMNDGDRWEPFNHLKDLVNNTGVLADSETNSIWQAICDNIGKYYV